MSALVMVYRRVPVLPLTLDRKFRSLEVSNPLVKIVALLEPLRRVLSMLPRRKTEMSPPQALPPMLVPWVIYMPTQGWVLLDLVPLRQTVLPGPRLVLVMQLPPTILVVTAGLPRAAVIRLVPNGAIPIPSPVLLTLVGAEKVA